MNTFLRNPLPQHRDVRIVIEETNDETKITLKWTTTKGETNEVEYEDFLTAVKAARQKLGYGKKVLQWEVEKEER